MKYPSLLDRIQSTFIDLVIILILMLVLTNILDRFDNVPNWICIGLLVLLFIAYEPLCIAMACTPGNYIKGIRVRKFKDPSRKINLFQAAFRYVIKFSLGWLSFVTIHSNTERRAIHDFASGSVMIRL